MSEPSGASLPPPLPVEPPPLPIEAMGWEDLDEDRLLRSLPRQGFHGQRVPVLGGIPLLAALGRGGMGAVYYGIDPATQEGVAVKVLTAALAADDAMVERFAREAQVASQLESPHLVATRELQEDRGLFHIVMEYVHGCSAAEYAQNHGPQLAEGDTLDIVIAATKGLTAVHARRVLHRDIKPANIFLLRDRSSGNMQLSRSKLGDLGIARDTDAAYTLTETDIAMGTPGYMAPEQCLDARGVGRPADIFSMGATLYRLLSGSVPFQGESPTALMLATARAAMVPIDTVRPGLSRRTQATLARALQRDPLRRHQDAQELLQDLEEARSLLRDEFAPTLVAAAPPARSREHAPGSPAVMAERSHPGRLPLGRALGVVGLIALALGQTLSDGLDGPLSAANIFLHNLGHLVASFAPDGLFVASGLLLPVLLGGTAVRSSWRRGQPYLSCLAIAWMASYVRFHAVYARSLVEPGLLSVQDVENFEPAIHDWAFVLQWAGLGGQAGLAALVLRGLSVLLFGVAILGAAWATSRARSPAR